MSPQRTREGRYVEKHRRSGRRVGVAAGAGLVMALVLVAPGAALGAPTVRVTSPVQATKFDTVPSRQYGTPDIAVDPENPLNIVATLPELPTKRCGLMRSKDGGVTWTRLD